MSEEHILLVDDELYIRHLLLVILKKMGFEKIHQAKNGEEAVSLFNEYHPFLTLMDINMPVMDGLEALEKIMAISPDALVVMLTSMSTREVVEKCASLGASDYIRKDSTPDEITQSIKEIIE